jgi:hypothetical protein
MLSGTSDIHMQADQRVIAEGAQNARPGMHQSRGIEAARGSGLVVLIVGRRTLKFPDRCLKDRAPT